MAILLKTQQRTLELHKTFNWSLSCKFTRLHQRFTTWLRTGPGLGVRGFSNCLVRTEVMGAESEQGRADVFGLCKRFAFGIYCHATNGNWATPAPSRLPLPNAWFRVLFLFLFLFGLAMSSCTWLLCYLLFVLSGSKSANSNSNCVDCKPVKNDLSARLINYLIVSWHWLWLHFKTVLNHFCFQRRC